MESRQGHPVPEGLQQTPEVVVVAGARTAPAPPIELLDMLKDCPQFLRDDLLQGVDSDFRFERLAILMEDSPFQRRRMIFSFEITVAASPR